MKKQRKVCFKCGVNKPMSEFYKHKQMADGHLNKCKACAKKDVGKHRADNLEKVQAYDRSRDALPHRVAARKEYAERPESILRSSEYKKEYAQIPYVKELKAGYQKRYRERFPEKSKAHNAVSVAVRDGKIVRPSMCEVCGVECVPHGHHWSYEEENWLDVQWVCVHCHVDIHCERN